MFGSDGTSGRGRWPRCAGCEARRWLHVHHLTHWEDGGPTDPTNLVCLCAGHHPAHHKGEIAVAGDPSTTDGLVVTEPRSGRVLTGLAGPSPPTAPPPDAARALGVAEGDWRNPSDERLDRRWLEFVPAG